MSKIFPIFMPGPMKNSIEKNKLELSLVKYSFAQSFYSQIAAIFCASILLIGLYSSLEHHSLFIWYFFFLCIALGRILIAYLFFMLKVPNNGGINFHLWKNLFITGAFLGGFTWGLVGIIWFPHIGYMEQTLCILTLAGITAGAMPALAPIKTAVIGYYCLAIIPYFVSILLFNKFLYNLFGLMLFVYIIYITLSGLRMNKLLGTSITLQFEHDQLIFELEHSATHDSLTGLHNRFSFFTNLSHTILRASRNKESFCLFYIDLDKFKEVNDQWGHNAGDELLKNAAKRLKKTIRSSDLLARMGGDEYIILIEKTNREIASLFAQKICQILQEPYIIDSARLYVTASIGISFYPEDGTEPTKLVQAADQAMYYTKSHGKNGFNFYSEIRQEDLPSSTT